ncbi:aquaporin [Streptomyces sp. NPDC056653]|uniref:aquaporin n=1 Tax=Streptomyces sp. NPDC056653 TaxID=3345894 RepID=UPI003697735E
MGLLLGAAGRAGPAVLPPTDPRRADRGRGLLTTSIASLGRRVAAECIGTAGLVTVVVGSGIQSTELSRDVGVQLFANSLAAVFGLAVFGLAVFIALLGPASSAHFNPVVPLAAGRTGRSTEDGPTAREIAAYLPAQIAGAIGGAIRGSGQNSR